MASGIVVPVVAGFFFLLAALAYSRGGRAGVWLGATGVSFLIGSFAARGIRAGYWPLTGEYEFALAFALGASLAALLAPLLVPRGSPAVQPATMLLAAALVAYACLLIPRFRQAIRPLPPALDSAWLPLHVGTAALAYGALAMAGAAGLVWLVGAHVQDDVERSAVERLLDRAVAAGYPLLTLSMIFGMIWAQVAWGRYWGWDLKEVWTLITWLVYALYWHVRTRSGWRGRRLAWLSLVGLGAVLFTFLGTGWLARSVGLESLHLF
jgi:ABC-type transport system involved in cytochrome c biogenesis permease subunit